MILDSLTSQDIQAMRRRKMKNRLCQIQLRKWFKRINTGCKATLLCQECLTGRWTSTTTLTTIPQNSVLPTQHRTSCQWTRTLPLTKYRWTTLWRPSLISSRGRLISWGTLRTPLKQSSILHILLSITTTTTRHLLILTWGVSSSIAMQVDRAGKWVLRWAETRLAQILILL